MYYQVLKQVKNANPEAPVQPEVFFVEQDELVHFLHEQLTSNVVLVFSELPARNVYTLANKED